ncbi:porin [Flavobacterium sp.]|uniref:porin n=2 Tax=Flavobacterium sp. TaxID=239 RepID=UPI002FDB4055
MKKTLQLLLLLFSVSLYSQIIQTTKSNDIKLSTLPYYSFKKGIGITTPDSLFQLNIRFRIQNRVTYIKNEDENGGYDGQVRRLRLRFDGFVMNPKFQFALQLSFAPGDVGVTKDGQNLNVIRDAVVYYKPNKHWSLSFGQTKLPGNRQTVNSSGALQLTDRSINNTKFTIDRDFGFQIHNFNEFENKFSYNFKAALSGGEGRNQTGKADDGVAVTGKIEVLPFGAFTKDGTYFEGDIQREKKPKLMLSGAFQQNNHARRAMGETGIDLFETRTMKSVLLDAMFKYRGWAAMASYMSRTTTDTAITVNPVNAAEINYAYVGSGFDYQLSYLLRSNYEVIGRFSTQKAGDDIKALTPDTNEYSLGVTKYLWEHTFKLQSELTFDKLTFDTGETKNNWYLRFQVEIGI